MTHPRAIQPLLTLAAELRRHSFAVSPDQTVGFLQAVLVLGPDDIYDIRRAAIAMFAISPDRVLEFDAIFNSIFFGVAIAAEASGGDDEVDALEPTGSNESVDVVDADTEAGVAAVSAEQLHAREFHSVPDSQVLIDFERNAKNRLPQRKSYRWKTVERGKKMDFKRTLRTAAKHDGEIFDLKFLRRKNRQRRILLLIDVSGSMKDRSASSLRFAHSLRRVATNAEVFTLGTRLTRITRALAIKDRDLAMQRVSQLVSDFDGGTRIGAALEAYLSIPKYAGFARGAAVLVLSDGLERGESDSMVNASQRLSRLAWRFNWLTPLAADSQYQPETEALKRVLPFLDQIEDGHSVKSLCDHVLQLSRTA